MAGKLPHRPALRHRPYITVFALHFRLIGRAVLSPTCKFRGTRHKKANLLMWTTLEGRTTVRKLILLVSLACLFLLAILVLRPGIQVQADGPGIVGTWLVTTTPNVPPGTPPFSYSELVAFNPGGTLVDTHAIAHGSELPFLPPPVAVDSSDAFGVWRALGNTNQVATTHQRLLFAGPNTPAALYGPFFPGQHVGFETVQTVLTLQTGPDGDTLSGPFTVEFVNLSGQVVFADSGTVVFKRLRIQPLVTP